MYTMVSGQFPPEKNSPPVWIGVWVKVRVSFRVGGQPDNCPQGKQPPLLGLGFGLGLVLGLEGNFSRGQLSQNRIQYLIELATSQHLNIN